MVQKSFVPYIHLGEELSLCIQSLVHLLEKESLVRLLYMAGSYERDMRP
jgi:hypothetical protein